LCLTTVRDKNLCVMYVGMQYNTKTLNANPNLQKFNQLFLGR